MTFQPLPAAPPQSAAPPSEWLTRAQASAFLEARGIHMKPTTLARAYSTGSGGPPCRHVRNKPYYPPDLLGACPSVRGHKIGISAYRQPNDRPD